MALWRKY